MDTAEEGGDTGKKPVEKEVKVGGAARQRGREETGQREKKDSSLPIRRSDIAC